MKYHTGERVVQTIHVLVIRSAGSLSVRRRVRCRYYMRAIRPTRD